MLAALAEAKNTHDAASTNLDVGVLRILRSVNCPDPTCDLDDDGQKMAKADMSVYG
jgi:hypothetical protein